MAKLCFCRAEKRRICGDEVELLSNCRRLPAGFTWTASFALLDLSEEEGEALAEPGSFFALLDFSEEGGEALAESGSSFPLLNAPQTSARLCQ